MTAAGGDPRPQYQRDEIAHAAGGVLVEYRAVEVQVVPAQDLAGIAGGLGQRDGLLAGHAVEHDRHGEGADLGVAHAAVGDAAHEGVDGVGVEGLGVALTADDVLNEHDGVRVVVVCR